MNSAELRHELREMIKAAAVLRTEVLPQRAIQKIFDSWNSEKIAFEEFETDLLLAAYRYSQEKEINLAMRREYSKEKFEKIEKTLNRVRLEIEYLNDFEKKQFAKHIGQINWAEMRKSEIRQKIANDISINDTTRRIDFVDPAKLIASLEWLEKCASTCKSFQKIKVGHRVANEHIELLVRLLKELWQKCNTDKFTRSFHREKSKKELEPVSMAAIFCVDIILEIDPKITRAEIDNAMKAVIRRAK